MPASADCAKWNPGGAVGASVRRSVTAQDLIELANIGRPDAERGGDRALDVSPDGRSVALVLQRADLATNGFCQLLIVVDLDRRAPPRVLDRGGDFLMSIFAQRTSYMSNGYPRLNAARWAPDGRSIAFLKRVDGRTQVWRATLDGRPASMLTRAPADVNAWAWGADGHSLLYSFDVGLAAAEAAISAEGRTGWHYDERMVPHAGMRPQVPAPLPQVELALDPDTGRTSAVSADDRRLLALGGNEPLDRRHVEAGGLSASAERVGMSPFAARRLNVTDRRGQSIACSVEACSGSITGLWWDGTGKHLTFAREEGWDKRYTALYRWAPGRGQPRRIVRTDDVIEGCSPAGNRLVCVREGLLQPPRLVAIDKDSGSESVLLDPNPGFSNLILGSAQRIEWRNNIGREVYGDLVLPPGYKGGRLPVIVTLYYSQGFLRGGTGNEYPIQLLARRGFAVLSINRPTMVAADDPTITTSEQLWTVNNRNWADRRSLDSAINAGLDLLVAKGIADPGKLALTGLSDGASSVRFALSTSTRFAAAAISSCCVDEATDDLAGPAWEKQTLSVGYPPAFPVDENFWRPYSLALNARQMDTPLLMQLSDYELLIGIHAYTALKAARAPVDLFFYPDEYHFKWQPEHRAAVFERNLDWFSFWLAGREDPAADKAAQFARWRELRAIRDARKQARGKAASAP